MSARAEGRHVDVDCTYPREHEAEHRPHRETGRLVCLVCHPPAYVLAEREASS